MSSAGRPHQPSRGEVWQVDLRPVRGREQHGMRPALILSVNKFNHGPADLVIVIPITSRNKGIPTHVAIPKGEGGLDEDSFIKCEDIRSISKDRLIRYRGDVTYPRIEETQHLVRLLLGL
ncbi:MAG: type II toxin-antitoxin system PemK/MazF family toxin [Gemmatimonadaceae bacterium]